MAFQPTVSSATQLYLITGPIPPQVETVPVPGHESPVPPSRRKHVHLRRTGYPAAGITGGGDAVRGQAGQWGGVHAGETPCVRPAAHATRSDAVAEARFAPGGGPCGATAAMISLHLPPRDPCCGHLVLGGLDPLDRWVIETASDATGRRLRHWSLRSGFCKSCLARHTRMTEAKCDQVAHQHEGRDWPGGRLWWDLRENFQSRLVDFDLGGAIPSGSSHNASAGSSGWFGRRNRGQRVGLALQGYAPFRRRNHGGRGTTRETTKLPPENQGTRWNHGEACFQIISSAESPCMGSRSEALQGPSRAPILPSRAGTMSIVPGLLAARRRDQQSARLLSHSWSQWSWDLQGAHARCHHRGEASNSTGGLICGEQNVAKKTSMGRI
ncbi:hypothetical protein N7532_004910 [Penicillium argentinense]|uniref:Uncharacterized protein n=1 Tax=Penicillium argentinense TaxID=1131581 RepID=A0A9W9FD75_9EURO|nr:uncharacterized protein N7532_004910 [Penicillium argentinense]KAJ5097909.1 hypothetical protein N7532_004910 [Penicillium argentinense]